MWSEHFWIKMKIFKYIFWNIYIYFFCQSTRFMYRFPCVWFLTWAGRSQHVSSKAQVMLHMISNDCSWNWGTAQEETIYIPWTNNYYMFYILFFIIAPFCPQYKIFLYSVQGNFYFILLIYFLPVLTAAEPLRGPRVLTSLPSISKPSVGMFPRGRAGLSPTLWQSTDKDTLTWLMDRWICHS